MLDIAVIGGGAAGFFAAINLKIESPHLQIAIFEKSSTVLNKVRVSGGGRCNVTHACFDPKLLVNYYPRGAKELLSVFKQFSPADTVQWFEGRGLKIKTESDGRMFPVTDLSESVITCFLDACREYGIQVYCQSAVNKIVKEKGFRLEINGKQVQAKMLVITAGSSPFFWNLLKDLGHRIIEPVPSLFTFNIKHALIQDLQGISVENARLRLLIDKKESQAHKIKFSDLTQTGPLLITHWGLSGPAVLKLSSIAAHVLHRKNYRFKIELNLSGLSFDETLSQLQDQKEQHRKKQILNTSLFSIPQRWWQRIISIVLTEKQINWSDLSKREMQNLATALSGFELEVNGKSTNKEEFVTAGGVDLKEVDFKTMQSKLIPGMYLAGEVLNIDALTGGFNFQAAWSEAWVISKNLITDGPADSC